MKRKTITMKMKNLKPHQREKKVKSAYEPSGSSGRSLSRFLQRLRVFLLPTGWDASLPQGYPQHYARQYPFVQLSEERNCESKVSCPRTQRYDPDQTGTRTARSGHERTNNEATVPHDNRLLGLKDENVNFLLLSTHTYRAAINVSQDFKHLYLTFCLSFVFVYMTRERKRFVKTLKKITGT